MRLCKLRFLDDDGTRRERFIKDGESVYFTPCSDKKSGKFFDIMVVREDCEHVPEAEEFKRCVVVSVSVSKI